MTTALPESAPVAVLAEPGEVHLEDRPVPVPGERQVLVEVQAVGVCGSDVHYYREGRIGDHVVREPLVLGHEASGRVVGTGDGVRRLQVGDRVSLEPGVPCSRCEQCRAGRYNLCPDVVFFATPPVDGAFARYVVLDEDFAHPLPDGLSFEEGALLEPLSVAVWACERAQVAPGDEVLVTGAGPVGLLCLQVARARGASRVTVTDVVASRLELAGRLGADAAVDVSDSPLEESGVTAHVLLECSGVAPVVAAGVRALRPAGRAVLVGLGSDGDVPLPVSVIQEREIFLTGTFRYARTWPTATALVTSGRVDLAPLVTSRLPLAQAEAALTATEDDPDSVKPVVLPQR